MGQQASEPVSPPARLRGAAHINHRPDVALLAVAEPPADMERPGGPFTPLAETGITDAGELSFAFGFEHGRDSQAPARDAGVPDRPAEIHFQSFVAAVDGEDRRQAVRQRATEVRVHGLDRQTAVSIEGEALVTVHAAELFRHDMGPSCAVETMTPRSSRRAFAPSPKPNQT